MALPPVGFPSLDGQSIPSVIAHRLGADGTPDTSPVTAGLSARVGAAFNRPADTLAYASGDLVANNTTAASVVALAAPAARVNGGTGQVVRARLRKTSITTTGASFRVHLFRVAPTTVTNGDNGVFNVSGAADYVGPIDITMDQVFTDGAAGIGAPLAGTVMVFDALAGSMNLYALIEARGAYTPASAETFTLVLEVVRD